MPIEFQPAAPAATYASVGAGAAEQFSKDAPTIASAYAAAADRAQRERQAGAELQQQGQRAAMQGQLQDKQLGIEQQHYGDQTALGYAQLQQHSADIDRHAEAQAWVARQDATFQDQLRLNQLNQGLSEVEAKHRDGSLDDESYADAVLQIKAHVSPLKMKLERTQVAHLQQEDKLTDMKIQRQAAHEATRAQFEARMMSSGQNWAWFPDDNGKQHPLVQNARTGEWYNPLLSNGGKGAGGDADAKAEDAAYKRWHDAHREAVKIVDGWAAAHDKEGKPLYPQYRSEDAYREQVEKIMGRAGQAPTWDEQQRRLAPRRAGGEAGGGGDYSGGPGGPPQGGQPEPPPAAKKVVEENRPFDPRKWETDATEEQKASIRNWNAVSAAAGRFAKDPAQLQSYREHAHWAAQVFARYGSVPAMPEGVRQQYLAVKAAMRPFLAPDAPPPAPKGNLGPHPAGAGLGDFPGY